MRLQEVFPERDFSDGTANHGLIVKPWATNLAERDTNVTDDLLANMSIVQVLNNPDASEEHVDQILSNFNVTRREGTPSTGFLSIYFAGASTLSIPVTASFVCGNVTFTPVKDFVGIVGEVIEQDTEEITYVKAIPVGENEYVFAIQVTSTEITSSVIGPGVECTNSQSSPFIQRVVTASTFTGGTLPETTAELLERAQLGITAPAASGKDHIRSLLESSPYNVLDSAVFGLGDKVVIRDTDILSGVSVGGHADAYVITSPAVQRAQAPLLAVREGSTNFWTMNVPEDVYPGAYGVSLISREGSSFSGELEHLLGYIPSGNRPLVQSPQDARYSAYQTLTIRFEDSSGGAVDTERSYVAEVLYMPSIALIQDYVEDETRQASTFDILVKAMIPIEVSTEVSITYPTGVVAPDISVIQEAITDAINGMRSGVNQLYITVVSDAVHEVFPEGTVQTPLRLGGRMFLPSGMIGFETSTDYLAVPDIDGVVPGNVKYFCTTADVSVFLTEGVTCV